MSSRVYIEVEAYDGLKVPAYAVQGEGETRIAAVMRAIRRANKAGFANATHERTDVEANRVYYIVNLISKHGWHMGGAWVGFRYRLDRP